MGAPYLDGQALAKRLNECPLEGFWARPLTFMPTFQKHAKKICGGVQIHVSDRQLFRPYETYLALIAFARALSLEGFRFRTERYEFVDTIPAIDLLTGSAAARQALEGGDDPLSVAKRGCNV